MFLQSLGNENVAERSRLEALHGGPQCGAKKLVTRREDSLTFIGIEPVGTRVWKSLQLEKVARSAFAPLSPGMRTIATNTFDSQAYARTHYVQMGRFVSHGSKMETGADLPYILHILLRNPPLFQ